ncbi:hypothetical protein TWF970_001953 [Orbilia oligospora]|uniref:CHAT domain-containing protein n=1 Tax=Orbilia oligospora TaxID=2813651 RepID=A0A7C8VGQ9_ORBOL|nr:hypothetical protein TWF970_001953 [Orbilia oligospora]
MDGEQVSDREDAQMHRTVEMSEHFDKLLTMYWTIRNNGYLKEMTIEIMLGRLDIECSRPSISKNLPAKILCNRFIDMSSNYRNWFEKGGGKVAIDLAISALEVAASIAVKCLSGDRCIARYIPVLFSDLASLHCYRFYKLGNREDIEIAIQIAEGATVLPLITAKGKTVCNLNLAELYYARFHILGRQKDLQKSIQSMKETLACPSIDTSLRDYCLSRLQIYYLNRFMRSGDRKDFQRALELVQEASLMTWNNDPLILNMLICIKEVFDSFDHSIFGQFGDPSNSGDTFQVQVAEQAVAATPENCPSHVQKLLLLAFAYDNRFSSLKDRADLQRAIQTLEKAASLIPTGEGVPAPVLSTLSCQYERWFQFGGLENQEDLWKVMACNRELFTNSSRYTPLESRILSGVRLCNLYLQCGANCEAAEVMAEIIALLSQITQGSLDRRDHEYLLSQTTHLSCAACSLFLEVGRSATEAFRVLEAGRGVMASLAIRSQTSVSLLEDINPQLHKRYQTLRNQLCTGTNGDDQPMLESNRDPRILEIRQPFFIERELQETEDEIRKIPGFSTFQLSLGEEELKSLATDGPIVAFNNTADRCDALIITTAGVEALLLEDLDSRHAVRRITRISQISGRHPTKLGDNNDEMEDLLKWLWVSAVRPVLDHLGYIHPAPGSRKDHKLPRIWWITCGALGLAPLHAAGIYGKPGAECAMDFVVSSYISTAQALDFARTKSRAQLEQSKDAQKEALLVSASDEYLGFEAEIQDIRDIIQNHCNPITLQDASRTDVLHQLKSSKIAHFACHGVSVGLQGDPGVPRTSPSDSYLLLKGSKDDIDGKSNEKITVADLVGIKNPKARLAYLSACSTAKISPDKLSDETINIANAFQLAGYPHVVGTIWEAEDESATMIAKSFYEKLWKDDSVPQSFDVALALHRAVKELMNDPEWKDDFIAWAPFVHIGA